MSMLISRLKAILRPFGKASFLRSLVPHVSILDVGCGNNSPYHVKKVLPACIYTGIDIQNYNQKQNNCADHYVITTSGEFATQIADFDAGFDAVISAHNLEHCEDRFETLKAMASVIKPGGKLYLSFPCKGSISFPKRGGTLNYYDDESHREGPPEVESVIKVLKEGGLDIIVCHDPYRPIVYRILGFLLEPISAFRERVMIGTWDYYGFETVIWAQRPNA